MVCNILLSLTDRSSGRGRPRGQGNHQMRDLATSHTSPSPHDPHSTCFFAQRRTVRRKKDARQQLDTCCVQTFSDFPTVNLFVRLQADSYIRDGGQRSEQCGQQPGLPPQTAKKERHQVLHRTTVWEKRKGQTGAAGKRDDGTRARYGHRLSSIKGALGSNSG